MTVFWIMCGLLAFVGAGVLFGAPYVPSRRGELRELFDNALVLTSEDVVVDIGSGDGVVLREVVRRGARAIGYEIHPLFVVLSWLRLLPVRGASVRWANAWHVSFPADVTIVYAFCIQKDMPRLLEKVQAEATRLRRPLRLVSYGNRQDISEVVARQGAYTIYELQPACFTE